MVQPLLPRRADAPTTNRARRSRRRRAFTAATVAAFTIGIAAPASADEARCGVGLVLNVPDATANDIASAICAAARARQVSGTLRIGLVQASSLAVTIARVDANGTEQVQRLDARDANDAIQRAPNLLAPWAAPPTPAQPSAGSSNEHSSAHGGAALSPAQQRAAPTPDVNGGHSKVKSGDIQSNQRSHLPEAPSSNAMPADDVVQDDVEKLPSPDVHETPPPPEAVPKQQTQESLSRPRLIPGLILGAHGGVSVSKVASGVATGGGAAIGLGDEHVQGLADFTYAQNETGTASSFRHVLLTGGARMVVGDAIVRPAFGGGWSISYFEAGRPNKLGYAEGGGLGVYGDLALFIVPSKGHEIGAVGRLNIPLYSGERTVPSSYSSSGVYQSSGSDLAPVQLTFLAAYVHPFK